MKTERTSGGEEGEEEEETAMERERLRREFGNIRGAMAGTSIFLQNSFALMHEIITRTLSLFAAGTNKCQTLLCLLYNQETLVESIGCQFLIFV